MTLFTTEHLAFFAGLMGNIISFLVFLAPVPTFYTIYKKKSSDGFQSLPYIVAFFSASLLLYYAFLKKNAYMLISINAIGCVIELVYLTIFLIFASREARMFTVKLILASNVGALGLIILITVVFVKTNAMRVTIVGWTCAIINLAVFAAPLSIMKQVITTRSVEFMPFSLSFFLTLCATAWFFYGLFVKDLYVAVPNVMGFILGIVQMTLYMIYKNAKPDSIKMKSFEKDEEKAIDQKQAHPAANVELRIIAPN
uniref:Bidirectional sugar transporter SWEET n=1 Tax=Kalanchoe fedtschenkoi TaxID=63787 RepID=A0A7N0TZ86_KALFE